MKALFNLRNMTFSMASPSKAMELSRIDFKKNIDVLIGAQACVIDIKVTGSKVRQHFKGIDKLDSFFLFAPAIERFYELVFDIELSNPTKSILPYGVTISFVQGTQSCGRIYLEGQIPAGSKVDLQKTVKFPIYSV